MRVRPHRLTFADYGGEQGYSLTFCTHRRWPYFAAAQVIDPVRLQFLQNSSAEQCAILAYCFMPDHLHAIVQGATANADLPRFVRLAKQRTGFVFTRQHGGKLWQESYFDRTLRSDDALPEVVRYVINHPVRAGLVSEAADYPFWGSGVYSREDLLEFVSIECE